MKRLVVVLVLLVVSSLFTSAQVTVNQNGYATASGPAFPATPVSPPILFTPVVHLGQYETSTAVDDTTDDTAENNGGAQTQRSSGPNLAGSALMGRSQMFNFGAAQLSTGPANSFEGKSLAELAKEFRHDTPNQNVRTFTNSDVEKLGQQTDGVPARSTGKGNWVPNNGVIDPNGVSRPPQPDAGGAPASQRNPDHSSSPFSPRSQSTLAPNGAQPSTEIAQNQTPDMPGASVDAPPAQPTNAPQQQLPESASNLPLIGTLGFVSVSAGLFVRYQRAKTVR